METKGNTVKLTTYSGYVHYTYMGREYMSDLYIVRATDHTAACDRVRNTFIAKHMPECTIDTVTARADHPGWH